MFGYEKINLKKENGKYFYYQKSKIEKHAKKLVTLAKRIKENNYNDVRNHILLIEKKANNLIEGIQEQKDELVDKSNTHQEEGRVQNLYYAYKYILCEPKINEENLHRLYKIISYGLLDDFSKENMGQYYRKKDVYIINQEYSNMLLDYDKGLSTEKIPSYMQDLLHFIQEDVTEEWQKIIKSQIIHFYFVYIHPYFDGNGRCARTLSQWYLLREKEYPFTFFNREVSLDMDNYKKSILKSKQGDITPFLEFMLSAVENELKKEIIIMKIQDNTQQQITKEEQEILIYLLSTENHTLSELKDIYLSQNKWQNNTDKITTVLTSLIEKGIIIQNGEQLLIKKKKEEENINTK